MGQKFNQLTILKNKKNYNFSFVNSKLVLNYILIIKTLEFLFRLKGVWVLDKKINQINNVFYLNFQIFLTTVKTSFFKKQYLEKKNFF